MNRDKQSLLMKRRHKLKQRRTKYEYMFEDKLKENNVRYLIQKGFFISNTFRIVDFYMPRPYKIAIEIDGGYHETSKEWDAFKDERLLTERGIKTIRIKNSDVEGFDINSLYI